LNEFHVLCKYLLIIHFHIIHTLIATCLSLYFTPSPFIFRADCFERVIVSPFICFVDSFLYNLLRYLCRIKCLENVNCEESVGYESVKHFIEIA
jgi:hypothetical protein